MKKNIRVTIAFFALLLLPCAVTFAQTLTYITTLATDFGSLVASIIPVFIALAFLVFVWGLIVFIAASGDDSAKEEGRRRMIWGVLALFVITAIWGILSVLQKITGTKDGSVHVPVWTDASSHTGLDATA
jgi:hypothetical protein